MIFSAQASKFKHHASTFTHFGRHPDPDLSGSVPGIDCILFADPKRSTVDIVQAVGRALRRSEGKEFGYVVVPVLAANERGGVDRQRVIDVHAVSDATLVVTSRRPASSASRRRRRPA